MRRIMLLCALTAMGLWTSLSMLGATPNPPYNSLYLIGEVAGIGWNASANNPMEIDVTTGTLLYRYYGMFEGGCTFAISTTLGTDLSDWGDYGESGYNKGRFQLANDSGENNTLADGVTSNLAPCTDGYTNIKIPSTGLWMVEVGCDAEGNFANVTATKILDAQLYIAGNLGGIGWNPNTQAQMTYNTAGKCFDYYGMFDSEHNFALSSTHGEDWSDFNSGRLRLTADNTYLAEGESATLMGIGNDTNPPHITLPSAGYWHIRIYNDGMDVKIIATKAHLYITGSFENNWIPNTQYELVYDPSDDLMKYTTSFYDEHCFILSTTRSETSSEWGGICIGRLQLANDADENNMLTDGVTSNLAPNTDGYTNIGLPSGGMWTISASYDNLNQCFSRVTANKFSDHFYITGDFGNGWQPDTQRRMDYDPATRLYTFTADFGGHTDDDGGKIAFAISSSAGSGSGDWGGFNNGRLQLASGTTLQADVPAGLTAYTGGDYNIKLPKSGLWKITFNRDDMTVTATPLDVLMPLTRSDFAGGKAHYFLVGSRQSDWRLQPEWEFKRHADGTYRIADGRFMYTALIGVAKVDNYDDYVHQRYEFFVNPGGYFQREEGQAWAEVVMSDDNLQPEGKRQAYVDYGDIVFTRDNSMVFYADHRRKDNPYDESEYSRSSKGIFVGTIELDIDGSNNPTTLSFSNIKEDNPAEFVFQLVGGNIYNERLDFTNLQTPLNTPQHIPGHSWGDAWIQYDDNGNPYHDAHGRYIYQTVYQDSWFTRHPTYFYRSDDDLAYTSKSVTFVNVESLDGVENDPYNRFYNSRTAIKQIGGHTTDGDKYSWSDGQNTYEYREFIKNDSDEDISRTPSEGEEWQCFVVKDIWIKGDFKVWSGFGGGSVAYEFDNFANNTRSDARWNRENGGGSAIENRKKSVYGFDVTSNTDVTAYAAYKDVIAADFRIGDGETLTFFNRMILWYNPADGMDNAVLQLVTEISSPQIIAKNVKVDGVISNNSIAYEWTLSDYANANHDRQVSAYVINRYRVTPEGMEFNGEVETVTLAGQTVESFFDPDNDGVANLRSFIDTGDGSGLAPGTYMYEVVLTFTDESGDVTKQAMSNQITLYSSENILYPEPVAIQLLLLSDAGEEYFITDPDKLAQYRATDTYLTYRTSADAGYYLINPTKSGATVNGITITQVPSADARRFIANNFHDYQWTSDFYVRALDATLFDKKMADYIDRGIVTIADVPVPTVTVNGMPTFRSRVNYLDSTADEQDYVVTIISRGGNLDPDRFVASLTYRYEGDSDEDVNAKFRTTEASTESQPIVPKPIGGTYRYVYNQDRVEGWNSGENIVSTTYVRIHVKSVVGLGEGETYDENADDCDVLLETEKIAPRQLDCEMAFERPNVTDDIVQYYDIYYTVKLRNNLADGSLDADGVYYDEEQIDYDDPSSPSRPADNYLFTVRNVHPSQGVYPVLEVTSAEYRPNHSAEEETGYARTRMATFGSNIRIVAEQTTQRLPFTSPTVYLNYMAQEDEWGNITYDWRYHGHLDFNNAGDILSVKNPQNITDENLVISDPAFYHVEVAGSGSDYSSYEFLWEHVDGHHPDGWEAQQDRYGRILNDPEDRLIGTYIAKGFTSPTQPRVYFTPVYVFFREPAISEGGTTGSVYTNLHAEVPSPSQSMGVSRARQEVASASSVRLPDVGSAVPSDDITDIDDVPALVAVQGGPTDAGGSFGPDGTLTGVEGVTVDTAVDSVEWFDLRGVRVTNPRPGEIYVMRGPQGGRIVKF